MDANLVGAKQTPHYFVGTCIHSDTGALKVWGEISNVGQQEGRIHPTRLVTPKGVGGFTSIPASADRSEGILGDF